MYKAKQTFTKVGRVVATLMLWAMLAMTVQPSYGQEMETVAGRGSDPNSQDGDQDQTLIVYLSRTGNTQAVAEIIHNQIGGELVELKLENPYPEDYKAIVAQVDRENETGYLPPLQTNIDNFETFDTVFIGFPTWDMQLPPPMKSFLHKYDLEGKILIPFNTNGGYGVGSSFRQVNDLAPNSEVLEGFSVEGGLEKEGILLAIEGERREEVRTEVIRWLRKIQQL